MERCEIAEREKEMNMASALTFKRSVNVPPAEVYRAFTHATALRDWLCDAAQTEVRKGGRVYLWWNSGVYASGAYTALEPGKKVAWVSMSRI